MNKSKVNKYNIIVLIVIFLLVIALVFTLCHFSSGSGEDFLGEGRVYSCSDPWFGFSTYGFSYDSARDCYTIEYDDSAVYITDYSTKSGIHNLGQNWHYLYYEVDYLSSEFIPCYIEFVKNGDVVDGKKIKMRTSGVVYSGKAFDSVKISYEGQTGESFSTIKRELRERDRLFVREEFIFEYIKCLLGLIACFFVLMICFVYISITGKKGLFSKVIDSISYKLKVVSLKIFSSFNLLSHIYPRLRIKPKESSIIRTGLFTLLFFNEFFTHNYMNGNTSGRYMVIVVGVMGLIILMLEKQAAPSNKRNEFDLSSADAFRKWIVAGFICLMLCRIISDTLMLKEYRYNGIWLIGMFGSFYLSLYNYENPTRIIREFKDSVHIFYLFILWHGIFYSNLLFKNEPFMGIFTNQNTMGVFVAILFSVFLTDFIGEMKKKDSKIIVWCAFECLSACIMVYKSTSRTGILAVIVMIATASFIEVRELNNIVLKRTLVIISSVIVSISLLASIYIVGFSKNLLNINLNELSTGRFRIWRIVVGKLNLFGHEKRVVADIVESQWVHNSFLAQMYMYGIFTVLPYIVLQLNVVLKIANTIHNAYKKKIDAKTWKFCLIVMIGLLVREFTELFEENAFLYRGEWFLYIVIGFVLSANGERELFMDYSDKSNSYAEENSIL